MCDGPAVAKTVWTEADFDMRGWAFQLFLNAITRSGPDERGNSEWTLSGDRFTIEVGAAGFTQYLRRAPVLSDGPWLSVEERGGFSFARESYGSLAAAAELAQPRACFPGVFALEPSRGG